MIAFPATAFTRDPANLKHAARKQPVTITENNRPTIVLLSIEAYDALTGENRSSDPRRSYRTANTPPEVRALLLEALEQPYEAQCGLRAQPGRNSRPFYLQSGKIEGSGVILFLKCPPIDSTFL